MKFSINKSILLGALTNVSKALSQKVTIPVLNCIKFELTKKELNLTGSDSELTIKITIPEKDIVKIENEGDILVQSKYLLEIVRKMPSDVINFSLDDNKLKIYSEINEFVLNTFDIEEYPNFKLEFNKNKIVVPSKELKTIIKKTSYAMSNQEIRPLLTGLNINIVGNVLECIATDSYRLAKKSININNNLTDVFNVTVPGKTILELESILTDEEDIELYFFTNKLIFVYKNIIIQTNLLSGSYPETAHFIPTDFAYMINLDLKELYDAVDRASIFSSNKDRFIVKLNIKGKEMIISSISSEIGKTEETISIDSNKVDNLEISISSKYLSEALKVIEEEKILLLLNSDDKPVIIKPIEEESYTTLILPIKSF